MTLRFRILILCTCLAVLVAAAVFAAGRPRHPAAAAPPVVPRVQVAEGVGPAAEPALAWVVASRAADVQRWYEWAHEQEVERWYAAAAANEQAARDAARRQAASRAPARPAAPAPEAAQPAAPSVSIDGWDGTVAGAIAHFFGTGALGAKATRVARCESSLDPTVVSAGGGNWGLFQINTAHVKAFASVTGQPFYNGTLNAWYNAMYAANLYGSSGWGPWSCGGA